VVAVVRIGQSQSIIPPHNRSWSINFYYNHLRLCLRYCRTAFKYLAAATAAAINRASRIIWNRL